MQGEPTRPGRATEVEEEVVVVMEEVVAVRAGVQQEEEVETACRRRYACGRRA